MFLCNPKRITLSIALLLSFVAVLSGCGGSTGGTVPFAALASPDGTGSAAIFHSPSSITNDGVSLYVTDSANHTIRRIVMATGVVTTLAGTAGASGSTDGTGSAAHFNSPYGISTDGTNLYVADSANSTIRKIGIVSGAVTTLAGTAGKNGKSDGTGTAALFYYPFGVTTDGTNLYVTDRNNETLRMIDSATGAVTTLAGTAGSSGSTDGTGTAALFNSPYGIATDGTNLYVADTLNHVIRKVAITSGVVTTLAGTAGTSGSTDGTGTAAHFNSPHGITTDGTNLYVADSGNNTIRKVDIVTGAVTTLAGIAGTSGSTNGTGSTALFSAPFGVTIDGASLYVTDLNNNTVRKIIISSGVVTTLAGSAP